MAKLYVFFKDNSDENIQHVHDVITENDLKGSITAEFKSDYPAGHACLTGRRNDLLKLQEAFEKTGEKVEFVT